MGADGIGTQSWHRGSVAFGAKSAILGSALPGTVTPCSLEPCATVSFKVVTCADSGSTCAGKIAKAEQDLVTAGLAKVPRGAKVGKGGKGAKGGDEIWIEQFNWDTESTGAGSFWVRQGLGAPSPIVGTLEVIQNTTAATPYTVERWRLNLGSPTGSFTGQFSEATRNGNPLIVAETKGATANFPLSGKTVVVVYNINRTMPVKSKKK